MQSLTELYLELRAPVYRFLVRMGCDESTAEELTQETFIQALFALPRYRGDASVKTWLFAIARNLFLKHVRRERRPVGGAEPPAPSPDPEASAEARQRAEWVAQALLELPELSRTVLVLREYEELSYAEVGAIVSRSETWCRVTCFRSRQQLKEKYLELSGGEMI